jgi:glutamate transport system substrate-binding protein
MSGFDVDVATYVAKELGYNAEVDIEWVQAVSAQRETLIESGQVDMIVATYSITDKRKEQVSFAGPYFIAGQDLLVRADETAITGPETSTARSSARSRARPRRRRSRTSPGRQPPGVRDLLRVRRRPGLQGRRRPDHRRHDPRRLRRAGQYKGKLKVVGDPFSTENYGIGLKKGDTEMCTKVTDAINKMIKDGAGRRPSRSQLRPGGLQAGPGQPAHPGRLRLTCTPERYAARPPRARGIPPHVPPDPEGEPMGELLANYDVLGRDLDDHPARGPLGDRFHGHRHDRRHPAGLPRGRAAGPRHELRQHLPQHAADRAHGHERAGPRASSSGSRFSDDFAMNAYWWAVVDAHALSRRLHL